MQSSRIWMYSPLSTYRHLFRLVFKITAYAFVFLGSVFEFVISETLQFLLDIFLLATRVHHIGLQQRCRILVYSMVLIVAKRHYYTDKQ